MPVLRLPKAWFYEVYATLYTILYAVTSNPVYLYNAVEAKINAGRTYRQHERRERRYVVRLAPSSKGSADATTGTETGRTITGRTSATRGGDNRGTLRINTGSTVPGDPEQTEETRKTLDGVDDNSPTQVEASRHHPRGNGPGGNNR